MFELNDKILKGQSQGRELAVKRALEYLNRLASEANDDASLQRELAVACLKIGGIQGKPYSSNLGDTEGAIKYYRQSPAISEQWSAIDPHNVGIHDYLADTRNEIGKLHAAIASDTKNLSAKKK